LLLAVLASGCSHGDSSTPASAPVDHLQANGIRYDLPLTGSNADRTREFLQAVRAGGLSWSGSGHTLVVADGKITLDGKAHGAVKHGDTVRLTADGQLFINNQRRQPTDQ
jgi:hypothetical protein